MPSRDQPHGSRPKADLERALLDHLIGGHEQRRRHGEAKGPGRLEIDKQLELGGVLHRQVAGLVALEDASDVLADLAVKTGNAGAVTHQNTGEGPFRPWISGGRWQT